MKNTITFPYYSGHRALGFDQTPGTWDGDTFTAVDGSKWMVDPLDDDVHPRTDGTGIHYLIKRPISSQMMDAIVSPPAWLGIVLAALLGGIAVGLFFGLVYLKNQF